MSHDIRDRAWLTAHVRMRTESRIRTLSKFLNVLIFWYSTVLTGLTVYQLAVPQNHMRDIASAVLAIAVLALSIFIPSLNLGEQADKFRECYLKLQRLIDTDADNDILIDAYHSTLEAYPNHPTQDYADFIVASKYNDQQIKSADKILLPTCLMYVSFWVRKISGFFIKGLAFISPVFLYLIL